MGLQACRRYFLPPDKKVMEEKCKRLRGCQRVSWVGLVQLRGAAFLGSQAWPLYCQISSLQVASGLPPPSSFVIHFLSA